MFTGIIEEVGTLEGIRKQEKALILSVRASRVLEGTRGGDSICTNGVCLTVTQISGTGFSVDVMPETADRSTLREMKPGAKLNLERALRLSDRLGGHLVTGHIDGTGKILDRRTDANAVLFTISCDAGLIRYMVKKGSIAVDGISLTIIDTTPASFTVGIIPHTLQETGLSEKHRGAMVNIECDILGKYVEKLVSQQHDRSGLTMEKLWEGGYI